MDKERKKDTAGFKCPNCGTILYSRNQSRCADCKTTLPPDLQLPEECKKYVEDAKAREKKAFKEYLDALSAND